jgi:glutamate--cysteine ligase
LQTLNPTTAYLPYATSLRMSDLGYQSKAQATLKLCYNDLPTFLDRLYTAVTTPWPDYQAIGTQRDGQWLQLNCNLLQIENEYYSTIRPKRTTARGERPITALAERGVQYIEVRCLDIDPFASRGISSETVRFMDAFLLFCALEHSPSFGDDGFCVESAQNFNAVVSRGRQPGLTLYRGGVPVGLDEWASDILTKVADCADLMATEFGDAAYRDAVDVQQQKVNNISLTPSAKVLAAMGESRSFHDFALTTSAAHTEYFRQAGLTPAEQLQANHMRDQSVAEQLALEASDTIPFAQYVENFHAALQAPPVR